MATKKDNLNERLRWYENMVAELNKKLDEMRSAKNDDFSQSPLYREMKHELLLADKLKDIEHRLRRQALTDERTLEQIKKIREDNVELCREHGIDYWEGIASRDKYDDPDRIRAEREILELKAALAAKDQVIEHLKVIISGEEPTPAPANPIGHPTRIDDETRKRVRKLRRQGWTMQQIADAEGISKGSVANIIKELPQGVQRTNK